MFRFFRFFAPLDSSWFERVAAAGKKTPQKKR